MENLFDYKWFDNFTSNTVNGVTLTNNKDGSFTFSGTEITTPTSTFNYTIIRLTHEQSVQFLSKGIGTYRCVCIDKNNHVVEETIPNILIFYYSAINGTEIRLFNTAFNYTSINITSDMLNDTFYIIVFFYRSISTAPAGINNNKTIIPYIYFDDGTRDISTIKWQDLALSNENLRQQFMQYFREGYYTQALALIQGNINIDSESIQKEVFNMMNTALTYLQNLYYDSVEVVLDDDSSQFQFLINNYITKGEYSSTVSYIPYNFVVYNQQVYMCIGNPPVGTLPTNATYWVLIGLKGEKGATSIDTVLKYNWSASANYIVKDVVSFENILYVAKTANINVIPKTNPNIWEVFMKIPQSKVIVSYTEPASGVLVEGGQWWKIDKVVDSVSGDNVTQLSTNESDNAPLENLTLMGNIQQVNTTGKQLFNNFLIPNQSKNGIDIIANDDGSTSVVGKGTLSSIIDTRYVLTHEETMKLIGGDGTQKTITVSANIDTYPYFILNFFDVNGPVINFQRPDLVMTKTIPDSADMNTLYAQFGYYGAANRTVISGKQYVMVTNGSEVQPWEPFSNQVAAPSPDFSEPVVGVGENYNILKPQVVSNSNAAIKAIIQDDGSLSVTGTTGDDIVDIYLYGKWGGTEDFGIRGFYTFYCNNNSTLTNMYMVSGTMVLRTSGNEGNYIIANLTDELPLTAIFIRLPAATTYDNTYYFMLNKGGAKPYQPYIGPNKAQINLLTASKQLCDASLMPSVTRAGVTITNNGDGSFTLTGTATDWPNTLYHVPLKDLIPGNYIVSGEKEAAKFYVRLGNKSGTKGVAGNYTDFHGQFTINGTETFVLFMIQVNKNDTVNETIWPMCNVGSTALPWSAYKGISSAYPILSEPLYAFKEYKDYIEKIDGQWVENRIVRKTVFNGSEEWGENPIQDTGKYRYFYSLQGLNSNNTIPYALCDTFPLIGKAETYLQKMGFTIDSGWLYIYYDGRPLAEWLTWLEAHPITVYWIPLSLQRRYVRIEGPSQVELAGLNSYLLDTNLNMIPTEDTPEPTSMSMSYSADIPTYVENHY